MLGQSTPKSIVCHCVCKFAMLPNVSPSQFTLLLSSLAYFSGNLRLSPGNVYVEVDTVQGRVRGARSVSRNGRVYAEFLGMPYAQPPLGSLRFEPPQPL